MSDKTLCTFMISGVETHWRPGFGGGEPVYRYVGFKPNCNSSYKPPYQKGERVCWELMECLMDDCHKKPLYEDNSRKP
jgi:hypothetical protein